jgi:hypothetical protein
VHAKMGWICPRIQLRSSSIIAMLLMIRVLIITIFSLWSISKISPNIFCLIK